MKICRKFPHPQAVQDADEFVSSSEQIWRNVALHHLLTNGSSAVNGCRQNESPNSWLKHRNNPQVIHNQFMSWEVQRSEDEKCNAACVWETNTPLQTSFTHNIAFSSKKWFCLNQERNRHRPKEPKTVLNKNLGGTQDGLFQIEWITCGLLWWCFYHLFELILTAPIHYKGSIGEQVMEYYISPVMCSDEETNSSPLGIVWRCGNFKQMYIFGSPILLILMFQKCGKQKLIF